MESNYKYPILEVNSRVKPTNKANKDYPQQVRNAIYGVITKNNLEEPGFTYKVRWFNAENRYVHEDSYPEECVEPIRDEVIEIEFTL